MKAVFIFYHIEYEEEIKQSLDAVGVNAYTKWERVLGKGEKGEPRLDTDVWPGFNRAFFIVLEEEKLKLLTKRLKEIRQKHKMGLSVFSFTVERLV